MTERSDRDHHHRTTRHTEDHDDEHPRGRPPPGLVLDPPMQQPEHPPEIPVDRLDQDALRVIYRLRAMGHQAYFVGGCVRDLLLGAKPKDFDLATDAHPGEVRAIFRNCRLIGRRFRLAHVYFRGGKVIEVATFRKNPTDVADDTGQDGDLLITRDNVFGTAEEDAVRRDFTVNGLFYDPATGEVIDYVGGRADLEAHRMATIGDPEIRMREDPVRALRAVRFAARLGFAIAPDTFEAMRRHAGELARCAPARVLEEIFKLLRCGGSARAFALLRACGALPVILPALGAAHERWDDAQRKAFFAHLGALDRLVRSGAQPTEVVLLGALIGHLGAVEGEGASDAAEALLAELVQTSRLPRRVAEGVRLALQAQRHFHEPPKKAGGRRRRRGRGPAGQPHFTDALQLLQISVEATGEGLEVLHRWRAEAERHPAHAAEDGEGEGGGREGHGRGRGAGRGGGQGGRERHRRHEEPVRAEASEVEEADEVLALDEPVRDGDTETEPLPAGGHTAVIEVGAGGDEEEGPDDEEAEGSEGPDEQAAGAAPGAAGGP
ncbi:MAG TPA: polynucleotide adenylyltransferase PcnB, partial [Anaeromyxobacteraceae bacterium]|nr:polynucleotide adenylyltransferase PcnB [Anaeromyxobacteraceae bacterium]